MRLRLLMLILVAMLVMPTRAIAQTPLVTPAVDVYIYDANNQNTADRTKLESCLAFAFGMAIYNPDGTPAIPAVVSFSTLQAASNPTLQTGTGLVGKTSNADGVYTWSGSLRSRADGPSELWILVGDNIYYQSIVQFTMRVEVEGMAPVEKTVELTNHCAPPPPPTLIINSSTWFSAGVDSTSGFDLTSNKKPVVIGSAFYHSTWNTEIPFTLTISGVFPGMQPTFHAPGQTGGVSYDAQNGIYVLNGVLNSQGATEVWLEMMANIPGVHKFSWKLESAAIVQTFEPYNMEFTLTNTDHQIFLPSISR